MSTTFLLKRGRHRKKAVAHIAKYDAFGEISGSWCGSTLFDVSSNVPWGRRQCRNCVRKYLAQQQSKGQEDAN